MQRPSSPTPCLARARYERAPACALHVIGPAGCWEPRLRAQHSARSAILYVQNLADRQTPRAWLHVMRGMAYRVLAPLSTGLTLSAFAGWCSVNV